MTEQPAPSSDAARELLSAVGDLTRRVRVAQRGTWFPLLLLGLVTFAVIPLYRYAPHQLVRCRPLAGGRSVCATVIPSVLVYWPIALVLTYLATAVFYLRASRRRGVGSPIRPYVNVGIAITALVTAASVWRAANPPEPSLQTHGIGLAPTLSVYGLASPIATIGLALLILAWVERNRALFEFSVGYLAVVLVLGNRVIHSSSQWAFLPQLLIPAVALLLASAGFAQFRPKAKPLTP